MIATPRRPTRSGGAAITTAMVVALRLAALPSAITAARSQRSDPITTRPAQSMAAATLTLPLLALPVVRSGSGTYLGYDGLRHPCPS